MKILILVAQHGHSFINQGRALAKGLSDINIDNKVVRITENYPEETIKDYSPTIVVGIGSWDSYMTLVKKPKEMGFTVLPWLVSDNEVNGFVDELNQLDFFLTTSDYCKNIFIKYGVKPKKMEVLYEAVDDSFWKKISNDELKKFIRLISVNEEGIEVPANYDLEKIKNESIPILFTTGGDATNKGAQEILNALSKINPEIPWIYIIKTWPSAGSFQRSIEEMKIVMENNLWSKIRYFSGEFSRDFIRNLMNVADIYIACSRSEGFGLPLVEAQMCGKPVITIDATSTREVVKDGITALVCKSVITKDGPRADIEDLAKKIEELLTNRNKINTMGKNARRFAKENFEPKLIANKLVHFIDLLV